MDSGAPLGLVFVVAIPMTMILFGLSAVLLQWGVRWADIWALVSVIAFVHGALIGGLTLRMYVRWKLESNAEPA